MKYCLVFFFLLSFYSYSNESVNFCENTDTNKCITPYGEKLGESMGVISYSNCRSECVNNLENSIKFKDTDKEIYTGLKWQCVEFARRWWILQKNITFSSVHSAEDIFNLKFAKNIESGQDIRIKSIKNGSKYYPKFGDLLIYKKDEKNKSLSYGHVAVVVNIDIRKGFIDLAEANYGNNTWEKIDSYSRRIVIKKHKNIYTIYDMNYKEFSKNFIKKDSNSVILGWISPDF